ncbi:hypothetical protein HOG98_03530 [bacterium]|jgi:hypothetical protein|nr:hypothetical protein [bacterium]
MIKISHRINTLKDLQTVPNKYGVELDIRSQGDTLVLHHDPFCEGEPFEAYLQKYSNGLMILNTKEEGLEERILELMKKYAIKDYFFLDLSLPFLVKQCRKGMKKSAVRFSEYEPLEFVMSFKGLVDWVWVDCFTDMPLTTENYAVLKRHFKLCLVSPELQGFGVDKIDEFKARLAHMPVDAVCTKRPDLWS